MDRPDHHNEIELNFVESGAVEYLLGGRRIRLEPGRLTAFWAAIPHQIIDYGEDTAYYVATVPLPSFLQWRLPAAFSQGIMQGLVVTDPMSGQAESDRVRFADWERCLAAENGMVRKTVLLEMQARLTRLAMDSLALNRAATGAQRGQRLAGDRVSRVEQMACFIARNYTQRISSRHIAEYVGLHPNYAMNLFQNTFGTTLISYLTQHRVSHAQRMLATTDDPIAAVAMASGFNSLSRFNDAFRRACGCSPRDYRLTHAMEV